MRRTKFRFQLLSFVIAMLVAAVLVGLNLRGQWHLDDTQSVRVIEQGTYTYGFPLAARSHYGIQQRYQVPRVDSPTWFYAEDKEGQLLLLRRYEVLWWAAILDLIVLIGAPALALLACEFLLRRRESRAYAS